MTASPQTSDALDQRAALSLVPTSVRDGGAEDTVAQYGAIPPALARDIAEAASFAARDRADSTHRAYASDWRIFTVWCASHGLDTLPAAPLAVAAFLAAEARNGRKPVTITRRLAAIRATHLKADLDSPTASAVVRATLGGIRRGRGVAPVKKSPATAELVRRIADQCDSATLTGLRDRALILLGFGGAFRRGELVALAVADLSEKPGGLLVRVRQSKTDQERQGATVPVRRGTTAEGRYCPVLATRAWLRAAGITEGPVFRALWRGGAQVRPRALSAGSVAIILKRYAAQAGLDPALFAGHSLRAGFLTSAAGRGATLWKLREVSRHRSVDVLAGYVRDAEAFEQHAGEGLL